MKDRNFVKEIEKLRTAVLGYDREEVVLYIRELVEYYGQKNGEAVRELYLEKMQLAAENAGLRAQIPTQEKLYAEAEGKAEEILSGAKETAATILDHAGTEKERMLKEAGEAEKRILAEADQKAVETIAEGKAGFPLPQFQLNGDKFHRQIAASPFEHIPSFHLPHDQSIDRCCLYSPLGTSSLKTSRPGNG